MKNFISILIAIILFSFTSAEKIEAQSVQSSPVSFNIKKMTINNNTNKLKMLIDMELTSAEASFITGIGATSWCSCYCDSIFDAWPSEVGGTGIPGTGTLYYTSSGEGGPNLPIPGIIQNGVLGIQSVEGGINRNTEFNVSLKFMVTD